MEELFKPLVSLKLKHNLYETGGIFRVPTRLSTRRQLMTYSATFKDHLARPRNVGELSGADASAEETNPVCGDRMRLSLSVRNERIEEVKFLAYGCPPTIVCGSVLTELVHGQEIVKAQQLTKTDLLNAVGGLPSRKHHAATLALETLHAALAKDKG